MLQSLYNACFGDRRNELVFDAEGATIIGHYENELAAHRAKRQWSEILKSYFLLENERDYETSVISCPESDYFVLYCFFTSACGRYAFWRLVNNQAPEAEERFIECSKKQKRVRRSGVTDFWSAVHDGGPWIFDAEEAAGEGRWNLAGRVRSLFRRWF